MSKPLKIFLVEDDLSFGSVLRSYLEINDFNVTWVDDGKHAVDTFRKDRFDLCILDVMLPNVDGFSIASSIRDISKSVPIIFLTAKKLKEDVLKGYGLGADDYVTKPFSPKELVARVIALLRRTSDEPVPLSNSLSFNNDDLVIDNLKHEVRKNGSIVNLTPNEYKILLTMIKFPQKTFTREELICMALGEDFNGYDRTVDAHIKNLRQKVESDPKIPRYILTIHGIGYRFGGEENEI